ncbi:Protein of unknown function [Alkalibacterium putridalgicola]|uniref:DUF1116 domain-containing protein n=1 Tax=Alkalibacterium putridalgicola TaxID=426703 RepID=A0A1H7UT92_9LACT|nr:DUF1116 domain-containing protein [Alkalibacterium putridalgicola]GEK88490.1 hypothetical protein APU01nite_05290 [Alkalibacterium putridalgicola]SEM00036.1 Protein of unknown function [Alkalibacterium putridalgicola]
MEISKNILNEDLKIINIGTSTFKKDMDLQNVEAVQYDWRPPAGGNIELVNALDFLNDKEEVEKANQETIKIIKEAHAFLVDVDQAVNVIPGMHDKLILHSGPPIKWENMCGPVRGAIIGALMYEGLAETPEEAEELAGSGEIEFAPAHEHDAVGPMAGIISPSMPVHVIENRTHGNKAYCTVNEGLGKVLRFGANSKEVIDRLKWIEQTFAPVLKKALSLSDGIDLKSITSQALHMGDECHNRNKASTSLFYREIIDYLLQTDSDTEELREVIRFIKENEHYFLNLSMPSCKSALDAAHGVKYSTVVTAMARNGVEFGIKVSGLDKDQWFTAPANFVKGMFFPGYSEDDAAPDLGDSTITETMGIGGFAMGASPAIVQFVGGEVQDAINYSEQMYEVTAGENSNYSIPALNFRGGAYGIDIRKVIETNILPVINTGMAHKEAGVGQIGAGIVHPPVACFEKAITEFVNVYEEDSNE